MLRLIAWVTLVISPLALLVLFHLQFLPYHHEPISWWHRIAVAADLVLLWTLWPSVVRGETTWITRRDLRLRKVQAAVLVSLALVFTVATFPGEWVDEHLPPVPFVPTEWPSLKPDSAELSATVEPRQPTNTVETGDEPIKEEAKVQNKEWRIIGLWKSIPNVWKSMGWTTPHKLLVGGEIDSNGKLKSLWSNRLLLPGIDAVGMAMLGETVRPPARQSAHFAVGVWKEPC
jgi:hypothetical protein